jgi:hypothetical protein
VPTLAPSFEEPGSLADFRLPVDGTRFDPGDQCKPCDRQRGRGDAEVTKYIRE